MSQDDNPAGGDIAREDELLELLYWFEGEGFGGVASMDGIIRFTNLDPICCAEIVHSVLFIDDV